MYLTNTGYNPSPEPGGEDPYMNGSTIRMTDVGKQYDRTVGNGKE
jgi:hypothetical protein